MLELDNGDLAKFKDVMEKWCFADHQSLMRFAISILFLAENKHVSIKLDGVEQTLIPSKDLLRQ